MSTYIKPGPSITVSEVLDPDSPFVFDLDYDALLIEAPDAPFYLNVYNQGVVDGYIYSGVPDTSANSAIKIPAGQSRVVGPMRPTDPLPDIMGYSLLVGGDAKFFCSVDSVMSVSGGRVPCMVPCSGTTVYADDADQYINLLQFFEEGGANWSEPLCPSNYQGAPVYLHIQSQGATPYVVPNAETDTESGIFVPELGGITLGPYRINDLPSLYFAGDQTGLFLYVSVSSLITG